MKKINLFKIIFNAIKLIHNSLEIPFSFFIFKKSKLEKEIIKMKRLSKFLYKKESILFNGPVNKIKESFLLTEDNAKISVSMFHNNSSNKWVVMNHWYTGHKYWMYTWAKPFITMGYNVLTYDLRNHGSSSKDKNLTLGLNESKDLIEIIDFLNKKIPNAHIGLFGISMGAFIVNNISNDTDAINNKNIKWAIADVSYASLNSLMVHLLSNRMVRIAKWRKDVLIKGFFEYQKYLTGVDDAEYDCMLNFKKALFPIRYSHSIKDHTTCFLDSIKFFLKRKCKNDEVVIYKKGIHGFSLKNNFHSMVIDNLKFVSKVDGDDELFYNSLKIMKLKAVQSDFNEKIIDLKGEELGFEN